MDAQQQLRTFQFQRQINTQNNINVLLQAISRLDWKQVKQMNEGRGRVLFRAFGNVLISLQLNSRLILRLTLQMRRNYSSFDKNKMQYTHLKLAFFAAILLLCSAAIAPTDSNSSIAAASAPSPAPIDDSITFYDIPLNLTSVNATTEAELNACFAAINDSSALSGSLDLAAAFERVYNDGSKQFFLYLDTVDDQENIHEYEGVVAVQNGDTLYRIVSIQEIPLDLSSNSTASSAHINILNPPSSQATPATLADFINSLAGGFTLLNTTQISADANLANIQKDIAKDFPAVANVSVAAIYSKSQGLSSAYLIFYSNSDKNGINLWNALVVADNLKKATYIIAFNSVAVPSSVKN